MSLYKDWQKLLNSQTQDTIEEFWTEYARAEQDIYTWILENKDKDMEGKVSDLAAEFNCDIVIFAGFLDGINDALKESLDVEAVTADTEIHLSVDFEKLYFNMHQAKADHLYTLPAWQQVLTEEERAEIYKDFKKSKTVHVEKKPGRNDPCPCGSGKKYKKCCGKNA